jgi:antitoxin component of MazEF toxin-antitoxin module
MLTTVLRRSGGSTTITIPKSVLELAGLEAGDVLAIKFEGRSIVLHRPALLRRRRLPTHTQGTGDPETATGKGDVGKAASF